MRKPKDFDAVQAIGDFTPIELGGHYAVIRQVNEWESPSGSDMIVVLIDFDQTDKQKHFFSDQYNRDAQGDRKWPYAGTKYLFVHEFGSDTTSRAFKGFCTSVERSNNFRIRWDVDDWGKQFTGKKIGAVYGEEEHEYEGRTSMRRLIRYFCIYSEACRQRVPRAKYLSGNKPRGTEERQEEDTLGFMPAGDSYETIPFT